MCERQRLIQDARQLGVPLDDAAAAALLWLLDELALWNRAYNLTALEERAGMVRAHLLDSLSAYQDLHGTRIADVGTGAGFPGLPLALACPQRRFTLIDSVGKKIRFVTHAVRRLGLANVTALQVRVETLAPSPPFETVLARAYAPLPQLLVGVRGLCDARTRVVALKGHYPREELAALPAGWTVEEVRAVHIPGLLAERHIVRLVPGPAAPDAAGAGRASG